MPISTLVSPALSCATNLAPYLDALNAPQRQAVETLEGPVLVLAGAGTGKTRALTTRIAHILNQHKAWPSQILAVTFTNKAAQEMRERVSHLMGGSAEGLWLGTFHALAVRILRRHAERVELKTNFTILDTDDQLRLIKQLLKADDIDDKKYPPRVLLGMIGRWKDRGYLSHKVPVAETSTETHLLALKIYVLYQERLRTLNAVDFGDILLLCTTLFSQHPDVLDQYKKQFKYILVDEYQDTNVVQYLWLRLLTSSHQNICCVGDDDQSIYGWRGAEVANILRFETDYPGAVIIRLEQNYRSSPEILNAASGLIAHNKKRLGKTLWTTQAAGERVTLQAVWDGEEEARFVGEEIERWHRAGNILNSMAILVRAGHQTREFEDRLIALGVPYRVVGGLRFYERLEIRDALAYLRLVAVPEDSLAFERIINTPRRGIGGTTIQTLNRFARSQHISLVEATQQLLETDELKGAAKKSLSNFLKDLARWHGQVSALPLTELAKIVLDESGYTKMWLEDKSPEAPGRLENLKELISAMGEFNSLADFLEHVSLVMDNSTSNQQDSISLMTLHSAKGLEFDTVFLAGWEDGLFPNARALEVVGGEGLEEERRLGYVGITRAKRRAYITFAANRRLYGSWQSCVPSRFIDELPKDFINAQYPPGLFTSAAARDRRERSTSLESYHAPAKRSYTAALTSATFHVKDRVFHQKFGYGIICDIQGDKMEVNFDHGGLKKVMAAFLEKG